MSINVVELFAGVGGFRLGFENASDKFKTIWANQWEPGRKSQYAFDCYVDNFGENHNCINEDIAKVKKDVPYHDLLCGGFPCQDYSVAATNAKGIEGKKGVLWWEIRDIIESKNPKIIFLVNVDRLLKSPASKRGRDFGIILRCLADLGYAAEWRVINAAEYGFRQKRRRTFILAYKQNTNFYSKIENVDAADIIKDAGILAKAFACNLETSVEKINIGQNNYPTLIDISNDFSCKFENAGYMNKGIVSTCKVNSNYSGHYKTLREILDNNIDSKYFIKGEVLDKWKYLKGAKRILRTKPNGEKYYFSEGAIPFPDNLDIAARTMLTSESSINRSSHIIFDSKYNEYRILTPEECEKINGFPVGWTKSTMPHKFRYFVMGNALVVGLIEKVAKIISEEFDS